MIDVTDVMEVRVDLLPPEVGERLARRRVTVLTGSLLGLWILVLGGLFLLTLASVNSERQRRDAAQVETARLQGVVTELAPFGQLQVQLTEQNSILASAMGQEVSTAAVLNDLALTFPASASLRSLNLTLADPVAAATPAPPAPVPGAAPAPAPSPGATPPPAASAAPAVPPPGAVGVLTFDGYSTERYDPGVQSILVQTDQADRLEGLYVTAAQEEDITGTQVTSFSGSADVAPTAATNRYRAGLPAQEPAE